MCSKAGARCAIWLKAALVSVQGGLLTHLGDVDVALGIGADGDDGHASHDGRRRVGAVRRGGDDAHVPVLVATRVVVGADGHEAGVLTAGSRVGLQ